MYKIIIKNNKYYPKKKILFMWFTLYYDGEVVNWFNRLKIFPHTYRWNGCPHDNIIGALEIIERNKKLNYDIC